MNVLPGDDPIDPHLWERPHIRAALARHDTSEIYHLLAAAGVSQRRIATLTWQNQSETSDINQGRQVQAYDLLARIADGLSIPRGYMAGPSPTPHPPPVDTPSTTKDDWMERQTFLGLVSKLVMGAALTPAELDVVAAAAGNTRYLPM